MSTSTRTCRTVANSLLLNGRLLMPSLVRLLLSRGSNWHRVSHVFRLSDDSLPHLDVAPKISEHGRFPGAPLPSASLLVSARQLIPGLVQRLLSRGSQRHESLKASAQVQRT